MNTFLLKSNAIVLFIEGVAYNIDSTHPHFDDIREELKGNFADIDWTEVQYLIDIAKGLEKFSGGDIEVQSGAILYKGQAVHNTIVDRILRMKREGFDINPMLMFLNNLMQNPSKTAVDELFGFLEVCDLPITPDGHFIAYKVIRNNWTDKHTGTMDNSVGTLVSMPRNQVDDNRHNTCSRGLHFCSKEYISAFRGGDDRLVALKINPKDVVSIPSDYNNSKGRASEYLILRELEHGKHTEQVEKSAVFIDNSEKAKKQPRDSNGRFAKANKHHDDWN